MKQPLSIVATSMVTPLGINTEVTSAIMRCKYNLFSQSGFFAAGYNEEPVNVSEIIGYGDVTGETKQQAICLSSIQQILDAHPAAGQSTLPLLLCLAEAEREHYDIEYINRLFQGIDNAFSCISEGSTMMIRDGRTGFVKALELAQSQLYEDDKPYVLIVATDSLVNRRDINHYGGDLYGKGCRLLHAENSNGFIPGEATAAILMSRPDKYESSLECVGIGFGEEPTLVGSEGVMRAEGLSAAVKAAFTDAGIAPHHADWRYCSASGESYFFDEMGLALQKNFRVLKPEYPMWSTADCLGEIGAATGAVMIADAQQAFIKGYAPGPLVMCQLSNDNHNRAAFALLNNQTNGDRAAHG